MSSSVYVSPAWLSMTVVATVFVIVYPLILGAIARQKLAMGWKYFWFGALVFLVFQLLTRIPLVSEKRNAIDNSQELEDLMGALKSLWKL